MSIEKNKNIELLAPAGSFDSFICAVNAGAHAIYMGLKNHNARAMAHNFSMDEFKEALDYANIRGVKIYLTLNTLMYDDEIRDVLSDLVELYSYGLSGVIVADLGLASLIHKLIPKLELHASTQMAIYSLEQVKLLESLGFSRVVLARELTLEEIKYISDNSNIELEIFIHGALCVSLSGNCMLSYSIGEKSANRGECKQPCRMKYSLYTQDGQKIVEDAYLLSKKDIYSLDILEDIVATNVKSLKIEGRNKNAEYVARVVSLYRKYLDNDFMPPTIDEEKELLQVFNRGGKSHGYLKGVEYKKSITLLTPKNMGLYLGVVLSKNKEYVKVKLKEDIALHDGIEIHSKNNVVSNIITCIKDENGKIINEKVEKGNIVYIGDFKSSLVNIGDEIYKTSSSVLNNNMQKRYFKENIVRRKIVICVDIKMNSPVTITTNINGKMYIYNTNIYPEKAINKEITLDDLNDTFSKTKECGIKIVKVVGYIEKGVFLSKSTLNDIRRNFIEKVESKYKIRKNVVDIVNNIDNVLDINNNNTSCKSNNKNEDSLAIYRYNKDINYKELYKKKYNNELKKLYIPFMEYIKNIDDINSKYSDIDLGVIISNLTLKNEDKIIKENIDKVLKNVKYVVLGTLRYLELFLKLKEKYNYVLIADYFLNVTNSYTALEFKNLGFDKITLLPEVTDNSNIEKIKKIIDIEVIDKLLCVMTSRYCILGAFVSNRNSNKCQKPCLNNNYYIKDTTGEKYDIICDSTDCTMKIIKKYKNNVVNNRYSTRYYEL